MLLAAVAGWEFTSAEVGVVSSSSGPAAAPPVTQKREFWVLMGYAVALGVFFASAGASAAYLTVSETWPIEIRAEAIAVFFAIGAIAGALGPTFYGALIGNGSSRTGLFIGYLVGAGIMLIGGLVEVFLGVQAAGKSLEQVTKPLTSVAREVAAPTTTAAA